MDLNNFDRIEEIFAALQSLTERVGILESELAAIKKEQMGEESSGPVDFFIDDMPADIFEISKPETADIKVHEVEDFVYDQPAQTMEPEAETVEMPEVIEIEPVSEVVEIEPIPETVEFEPVPETVEFEPIAEIESVPETVEAVEELSEIDLEPDMVAEDVAVNSEETDIAAVETIEVAEEESEIAEVVEPEKVEEAAAEPEKVEDEPEDEEMPFTMGLLEDPNPVVEMKRKTRGKPSRKPAEPQVVIDVLTDKYAWKTDLPGQEVKDVRSAISLNDRVMFIMGLFREDSALYADTLSKINTMKNLDDVVAYVSNCFPEWKMDSDMVYRFMMAVRRKIRN